MLPEKVLHFFQLTPFLNSGMTALAMPLTNYGFTLSHITFITAQYVILIVMNRRVPNVQPWGTQQSFFFKNVIAIICNL